MSDMSLEASIARSQRPRGRIEKEVGSEVMVKLGSQVRDQVDSGTATSRLRDRNRWIVGGLPHSVLSEPTHALRLLTAVPWPLLAYFSPTSLTQTLLLRLPWGLHSLMKSPTPPIPYTLSSSLVLL